MIKDSLFHDEHHPGIIYIHQELPQSSPERRRVLAPLAPHIKAAYEGTETVNVHEMSDEDVDRQLQGALDATHHVVAYRMRQPRVDVLGMVAYRIHDSKSDFVRQITLQDDYSGEEGRHITGALKRFKRENGIVFDTKELFLRRDHRNNGIGSRLREIALKTYNDRPIIFIGDIQNHSAAVQRDRLGGVTFWAGECIDATGGNIPYGLTQEEFRKLSLALIYRYVEYTYPNAMESVDKNGVVLNTGVFDTPLTRPVKSFTAQHMGALQNILERQEATGSIASAIAVTLRCP